nr:MAG TPA: hypothetical protein [Caudoviricetes sp.]
MKRLFIIFGRALFGIHSPSLGRVVRFSDIFTNYER